MTLTLAWVRAHPDSEELVVAGDSRLRAGYAWDAAPKILPLPRNDSVVAFAGATDYAYPMMIQAINTVLSWDKAANRGQPLEDLKGHLIRVFNSMLDEMSDWPHTGEPATPDALFLVAGFSWRSQRFRIWTVHFDLGIQRFTFRPAKPWRGGNDRKVLAVVGDPEDVQEAKARLAELLRAERKLTAGAFDWEPLQVLRSMIDDGSHPSVGGAPQVAKVYKSLKVVPFCVPWYRKDGSEVLTLLGRPLLDYEIPDRFPTLPPETPGLGPSDN